MKNAINNQVGMLGDMFLWLVANLKQGVIYFIKQALPPNISAGSVGGQKKSQNLVNIVCERPPYQNTDDKRIGGNKTVFHDFLLFKAANKIS